MAQRPKLPRLLTFEGLEDFAAKWTFTLDGFRCPNRGEYFISGAIPMAYKARNGSITQAYWIAKPNAMYKRRTM